MLKVMQIGYGYWGTNVTKKLLNSRAFELICLVENDENRKRTAKDNLPQNILILDDYHDMIDSTEIDAVVICTQTEYSYQIAIDAMEKGKHIFIEIFTIIRIRNWKFI